ncbi:MAG: autotransporter outer membrane beta-barrel domain-containing protein [Bacteroidaceae bacterium]|nr:autotransporter outer membrane beta-barrel domain-containing protein [Bacteroidaceae bacterium]
MKKTVLAILLAVVSVSANAQFEKGTKYVNASLTGIDMSYSKDSRFRLGFEGTGGYFVEECWMPYGRLGFNHQALKGPDVNSLEIGAGTRYYFKRTGVYLSGGLLYSFESQPGRVVYDTNIDSPTGAPYTVHYTYREKNNNISLALEAGYCFYVNHFMSIEPAVYYNMCLNDFSDGSRVGLKVGLGFYF